MTGSGPDAPQTLAEALERHGLPGLVRTRIEEIGRELRAAHAAYGNEHAALLDAATGVVQLHSHRPGTTLSLEDFALLVFFPGVRRMVVVAVDRFWYVLGVAPGAYPAPVADIESAMWDAFFALRPAYAAQFEVGELTREDAGRALWGEVWRTVSPRLGFLYHQVRE